MKTKKLLEAFNHTGNPLMAVCNLFGVWPNTVKAWGDVVPEKYAFKVHHIHKLNVPLEAGDYEKTKTKRVG